MINENIIKKVTLFEEYRLIERCESQVNGAWRGAHLLLFFLAFIFGSFCTFCFHMLMYLFDEKCVLFPKLLSLTSSRHNIIYEFIPNNKDMHDLPVDFLSTQWVEKNACTLPTYVPLLSGIFGLVWTTMFLMCSTGSRTLTGLQRPWRVLPPVFVFSMAMSGLCLYSSMVTHYGLQELCYKLGEITGSSTCTYTVNVATLAYERRIRGVYQATRLTILTAWLHTACWILSALLALVRVLLAVDFQLVKINVELRGDIDKMLQRHEEQITTIFPEPELWIPDVERYESRSNTRVRFDRKNKNIESEENVEQGALDNTSDLLFFSSAGADISELSLVPVERDKLVRKALYEQYPPEHMFIPDILYDLLESLPGSPESVKTPSPTQSDSDLLNLTRQVGQEKITSKVYKEAERGVEPNQTMTYNEAAELATEIKLMLQKKLDNRIIFEMDSIGTPLDEKTDPEIYKSIMNMADDLRELLEVMNEDDKDGKPEGEKSVRKSNLKSADIQMDKAKRRRARRTDSVTSVRFENADLAMKSFSSEESASKSDTSKDIEKEDDNDMNDSKEMISKKYDDAESSKKNRVLDEEAENRDTDLTINTKKDVIIDIEVDETNEAIGVTDAAVKNDTVDEVVNIDDEAANTEQEAEAGNKDKQTQTKPKEKQD